MEPPGRRGGGRQSHDKSNSRSKLSKRFFFEKKKQRTLIHGVFGVAMKLPRPNAIIRKPSSPWPRRRPSTPFNAHHRAFPITPQIEIRSAT
jgi:hypothetical protein